LLVLARRVLSSEDLNKLQKVVVRHGVRCGFVEENGVTRLVMAAMVV
jgi:hypothetical protein